MMRFASIYWHQLLVPPTQNSCTTAEEYLTIPIAACTESTMLSSWWDMAWIIERGRATGSCRIVGAQDGVRRDSLDLLAVKVIMGQVSNNAPLKSYHSVYSCVQQV